MTLNYSIVGIDRIESIKVFNYGKLINQEKNFLNSRIKKNLEDYPFISIHKDYYAALTAYISQKVPFTNVQSKYGLE